MAQKRSSSKNIFSVAYDDRIISNRSDKGDDTRLTPDENAAFSHVMMDRTTMWTKETADTSRLIKRDADLFIWWMNYIDGPLSNVPIGSEEFRQSRAGLIHHTFMNLIRREANLSAADFKALSLAEVFDVIEDQHVKEHNARNAAKQIAIQTPDDGMKPPKNCRASKNDTRKLVFYDKARNKSPHITYVEVADLWNKQFKDEEQTDESMRQAVSRGRKFKDRQRDNL